MTITDKTKAGRRRGRRAMSIATAAIDPATALTAASAGPEPVTAETSSGIASTADLHDVVEDARTKGENKTADDVVADTGSDSIHVGNGAPVEDGAAGTGAPRETRRQGRRAKQRPDTKAFASSSTTKVPPGKNARIAELVSRPEGAGIDELTATTGWQRHTVRAALTRLRQSGFTVELRTGEDGHRAYHHVADAEVAS